MKPRLTVKVTFTKDSTGISARVRYSAEDKTSNIDQDLYNFVRGRYCEISYSSPEPYSSYLGKDQFTCGVDAEIYAKETIERMEIVADQWRNMRVPDDYTLKV